MSPTSALDSSPFTPDRRERDNFFRLPPALAFFVVVAFLFFLTTFLLSSFLVVLLFFLFFGSLFLLPTLFSHQQPTDAQFNFQNTDTSRAGPSQRLTDGNVSSKQTSTCPLFQERKSLTDENNLPLEVKWQHSRSLHLAGENKDFIEATEVLLDPISTEKLQHLLCDGTWERFVGAAKLSRDKAEALYEDLNQLRRLLAKKDKVKLFKEQLHRERFMDEFPRVKRELEECVGKLHALADKVDKVHRDCTISHVVAGSTSVVSGILTILGLSLAPVTAGVSLVLSATGTGLGAAAAVTSVSTSIVDYSNNKSAKAETSRLVSTGITKEEVVTEVLNHSQPKIVPLVHTCVKSLRDILNNAHAFKHANSIPSFGAQATLSTTTRTATAKSSAQMQKGLEGTALVLSKGARFAGIATAGVALLMDFRSLVKESVHLHEGSKAQSAEEIRQQAQELERRLEELSVIYKTLQEA